MKRNVISFFALVASFNAISASETKLQFSETIPLTCGFVMENADLEGSIRFSDEKNSHFNNEAPAKFKVINNGNDGYATITMSDFSVWDEQNNFGTSGNKTDVEARSSFDIDNGLVGIQSVEPNDSFQVVSGIDTNVRLNLDIPSFRFEAGSTLRVTTILNIDCG
ncbi:hypothetical protein BS333_11895 [Vibrio azureus]|uniref:Uncharacterized protein n=1 Tax=Vibrio azureus NBRC 104587 TaxID=1219077 RepID=U3AQL2_9VIBR|nr:hypothetical protein [Vibrio azureus]AUI87020.1 hypothetical protein BS333_11895 [Vibrio azureus]GAD75572.1 hypothetical protein VAZ01S_026_00780 [Vibrio azureus NBRC 104587]